MYYIYSQPFVSLCVLAKFLGKFLWSIVHGFASLQGFQPKLWTSVRLIRFQKKRSILVGKGFR